MIGIYAFFQQQDAVLSELYSYANPDQAPQPADATSVMGTYRYLKAVEALFENGTLNNNRFTRKIENLQSPVLQNLHQGFQFFRSWCDNCIATCE